LVVVVGVQAHHDETLRAVDREVEQLRSKLEAVSASDRCPEIAGNRFVLDAAVLALPLQ
jgi:hypothetical protein